MRQLILIVGILCSSVMLWSQASPGSKDRDEVIKNLQGLIRIDTSNPPGNETKAAEFIKAILDKEGIPSEMFAMGCGKPARKVQRRSASSTW